MNSSEYLKLNLLVILNISSLVPRTACRTSFTENLASVVSINISHANQLGYRTTGPERDKREFLQKSTAEHRITDTETTWKLLRPSCWCCVAWLLVMVSHCPVYFTVAEFIQISFWNIMFQLKCLHSVELQWGSAAALRQSDWCWNGKSGCDQQVQTGVFPKWIELVQTGHGQPQTCHSGTFRNVGNWLLQLCVQIRSWKL